MSVRKKGKAWWDTDSLHLQLSKPSSEHLSWSSSCSVNGLCRRIGSCVDEPVNCGYVFILDVYDGHAVSTGRLYPLKGW